MSTNIVVQNARLSYVNLFSPRATKDGDPKYSTTVLVPKGDTASYQAIRAAVEEATQYGIGAKWNGKRPPRIDTPIHDGDGTRENGEPFGDECKGHWLFTASSKRQPGVVDQRVQPIMDSTQVYSGMYANVAVNFYPYDAGGHRGIAAGLNHVQKVRDGDSLGGGPSASEVFSVLPDVQGNGSWSL